VVAIARSSRGNTASCFLITSHFDEVIDGNISGAFVSLKLAEYFSARSSFFAKDLLFLFTRRKSGVKSVGLNEKKKYVVIYLFISKNFLKKFFFN
jgi:hypothetical protein